MYKSALFIDNAGPRRSTRHFREESLRADTFPALRALPGFVSASILSRPFGDGIEFLIVTQWRALEDIARFSGADLEAAVVPPAVAEMMIGYDRRVKHYDVVE